MLWQVRRELESLYTVDCLRRLATECLLPILLQVFSGRNIGKELKELKTVEGERPSNLSAVEDCKKDPYEGETFTVAVLVIHASITDSKCFANVTVVL